MLGFFKFIFIVIIILVIYHYATRRYLNSYKLVMVFGKKGSGKSTLLTKLALSYQKKNIQVYSTENISGCYKFDYSDIGYTHFPEGSVLLIDEVGMIWDNRNFKNFDPKVRDWFKLQRHRKIRVYLFSQSFDVDKKIRDLTDEMYLIENKLRIFSYAKRINKQIVLHKSTAEAPSTLADDMIFDSFLFFWCGSRKFTFIPKYAPYFNSFVADELEHKEYEYIEPVYPKIKRASLIQSIKNRFNS